MDKDTSDHVLNWLYTQVTSKEFHALSLETFGYIYNEKVCLVCDRQSPM